MNRYLIYLSLLFLMDSCDFSSDQQLFTVVEPEYSGIHFQNTVVPNEHLNILDYLYFYNGGGVALGDINNDGLVDIFIVSNQKDNKLYLNKGDLRFEDITATAGVAGKSDWNSGVTMADVNGDGLLDIYVCAVVGLNGLGGHNELFINNGDGTFVERAETYGLDHENYSTSAAFFDFDNDGDLDMYLLNHAVHTPKAYGPSDTRNKRVVKSGDKLMENRKGRFYDISEQAGIYGGINSYGLGLATADFNQDGYTDIYINNDFHENDYFYLNNGDGTFKEVVKDYFGQVSNFSMGSDVADINHDGFADLITLDMLPDDEKVLKSSAGDHNYNVRKLKTEKLGYYNQSARNMLQVNQWGQRFVETAMLSGVAATDWSWSALFADYNLDGEQDLFITNGIPKRPNDLDYINYISNEKIKNKLSNTKLIDQEVLDLMPEGLVRNRFFQGTSDLRFTDQSNVWSDSKPGASSGCGYADFDNDGDLDIITNNIGAVPTLYRNESNEGHYLKVKAKYKSDNTFGIGTKLYVYQQGKLQYQQLFTTKGFQSSSVPLFHFGFQSEEVIDSIRVIWPDNYTQLITKVKADTFLVISPENEILKNLYRGSFSEETSWFAKTDNLWIDYVHTENRYIDFDRQKLIPYMISDRGPGVAVGDLDGDGKDDVFFGNSKHRSSVFYLQKDSTFALTNDVQMRKDSVSEVVDAVITDIDQDGFNDILAVSGGGEFFGKSKHLKDHYYSNNKEGGFIQKVLPDYFENGSVVVGADFDNDGDQDFFIGGGSVSYNFGQIPNSYILINEGGDLSVMENEAIRNAGMITDAEWTDFDLDGNLDLILVGEWMSPKFYRNNKGRFEDVSSQYLTSELCGLWQAITPFDVDHDGEMDYLIGNWGLNTKFVASEEYPLLMYYDDFDKSGVSETLIAYAKDEIYYPLNGLDELSAQLSTYMKKKFLSYKDFAGLPMEQVFEEDMLKAATKYEVHQLASGYLKRINNKFEFVAFDQSMQLAPITHFLVHDFDHNGSQEVLAAGNYFGLSPYHGYLNSFQGAILFDEQKQIGTIKLGLDLSGKAVVGLNIIGFKNDDYLLVTINNQKAEIYQLTKRESFGIKKEQYAY